MWDSYIYIQMFVASLTTNEKKRDKCLVMEGD